MTVLLVKPGHLRTSGWIKLEICFCSFCFFFFSFLFRFIWIVSILSFEDLKKILMIYGSPPFKSTLSFICNFGGWALWRITVPRYQWQASSMNETIQQSQSWCYHICCTWPVIIFIANSTHQSCHDWAFIIFCHEVFHVDENVILALSSGLMYFWSYTFPECHCESLLLWL